MKLICNSLVLCLLLLAESAHADVTDVCKSILNAAQKVYTNLFTGNPETEFFGDWCYRAYNSSEFNEVIFAAVYGGKDNSFKYKGVYTMGGPFGNQPYYVDQTDKVLNFLQAQLPNNGNLNHICDTEGLPDAINYRYEDDNTYITTNGQCVELPENREICQTPAEKGDDNKAKITNVHLLTQSSIFNLQVSGFSIPGFDISSLINDATNHCLIHAPLATDDHTVHTDICIDITKLITSQFGGISIPGIDPPVTTRYTGISNLTRVDDCFDTNADSVANLVSGEVWDNQNGSFVKVK